MTMTLLFSEINSNIMVEFHKVGRYRIRIAVTPSSLTSPASKNPEYLLSWAIWQNGWNSTHNWEILGCSNIGQAMERSRERAIQEAIMFLDGLDNDGPQ